MIITAHGGAMKTSRNTKEFFNKMLEYPGIDAIEVDVRRLGTKLFLGHTYIPRKAEDRMELGYVFEYCKTNNLRVNCDLKRPRMVKRLVKEISKHGAKNYVYITGSVTTKDLPDLDGVEVYLNQSFYVRKKGIACVRNLEEIRDYIYSFGRSEIKGLNLSKIFVTKELLQKAQEIGLLLSIYTVDDEKTLRALVAAGVANITTNNVEMALKIKQEQEGCEVITTLM